MANQKILIDFPMKLAESDKVEYRIEDGKLFCFVNNNINFKKLKFKKIDCNYLFCTVVDGNVNIEKIQSMYILESPIDFIPDLSTTQFYNNFFDVLFLQQIEKKFTVMLMI